MTVFFDASLPAAGMVSTTAMGSTSWSVALVSKSSHTSPSTQAPLAMAFAESMTEPPPTASTQSTLASLQRRTPSRTRVISGFGRTPPSSKCSMPAASSDAPTRSMSPEATALPPPKCTSTRLAAGCRQLLAHLLFSPAPEDEMRGGNEFEVFHGSPFCFSTRATPYRHRRTIAVGRVLQSCSVLMLGHRLTNRQLSDHGKCLAIFANRAACHRIAPGPSHWSGRLIPVGAGYEVGHFRGGFGGDVGLGSQALVMGHQIVCLAQLAASKHRGVFVIRGDIAIVAS